MKALRITDAAVKQGRLVPMWNQGHEDNVDEWFYALWVEDHDGRNERCIVLTRQMLAKAEKLAGLNKEDLPAKPLIRDLLD